MKLMAYLWKILQTFIASFWKKLLPFCRPESTFTANVMAPLFIEETDWEAFEKQLQIARNMGITAVSTDIWWGLVEAQEGIYDWEYYDKLLGKIQEYKLRWMPIMSFHQCGSNVGDEFWQPLPEWVWEKLKKENLEIKSIEDLKYVSEEGTSNHEIIALWADRWVLPIYERFLQHFKSHYQAVISDIEEVNISCGSAGELRYPSYNYHDSGAYPNRGRLQCYSRLAKNDFRDAIKNRYATLKKLNQAWQTDFQSFEEIEPPKDAAYFFESETYRTTFYGREFIDWYTESLAQHGKRMMQMAVQVFSDEDWKKVPLGFKIPGIHWRMTDPKKPRSAEICAGLIPSHDNDSFGNGFGYQKMIECVIPKHLRKRVILHFTCLEMSDNQGGEDVYSKAQTLVFWIGDTAKKLKINLKGENALAGGILNETGWDNIEKAVLQSHYSGLTTLRIEQATSKIGQKRYTQLIQKVNQ